MIGSMAIAAASKTVAPPFQCRMQADGSMRYRADDILTVDWGFRPFPSVSRRSDTWSVVRRLDCYHAPGS